MNHFEETTAPPFLLSTLAIDLRGCLRDTL